MLYYAQITVYLTILGLIAFTLVKPLTVDIITNREFKQWKQLWIVMTAACFMSPMYVIFIVLAAVAISVIVRNRPEDRIVAYFLLLCTLPQLNNYLRGIAGIQNLFIMSVPRLLAFLILVPLLLKPPRANLKGPRGAPFPSDKFVFLFVLINVVLNFRDAITFTDALRNSFYVAVDILIPYLAISRALVSQELIEKAFLALLAAISCTAVVGIFESLKWWHVYQSMPYAHEILNIERKYDTRGGVLRANGIFEGPITFGYAQAIGLGLFGYFYPIVRNKQRALMVCGILLIALYCSVSRGAWVGAAVIGLGFIWLSPNRFSKMAKVGISALATIPFIALTPFWGTFVDLLPFVGDTRADTVDYRANLLTNAMIVIKRNLWFGSGNYLSEPELIAMTQGEGIIDLVNSYIQIALEAGVIGLAMFVGAFFGICIRIYFMLGKIPEDNPSLKNQGRAILAILAGILTVITTMSSIDYVPTLYWTFAAVGAAWLRIASKAIYDKRVRRESESRIRELQASQADA